MASESVEDITVLWSARTLVGALALGEAIAAILTLGAPDASWVFFGLASLAAQWILFLTLGALFLVRARLATMLPRRVAVVTFATLLASSAAVIVGSAALLPGFADTVPGGWTSLAWRSVAIVAIVGLLGIVAVENHRQARSYAVQAKQAELELLQARIRPHFLFNTLNTATALVHDRPDAAERVLLDLADLFRAALGKYESITLEEELDLTRRYLDIEQIRYGDRLSVAWSVPETLPPVPLPPLSLQPLVENAVRHGIERSPAGGELALVVTREDGYVRVEIRNPAPGADAGPAPAGHGVGLRASTARIDAATGGLGRVTGRATGSVYTTIVELPFPRSTLR